MLIYQKVSPFILFFLFLLSQFLMTSKGHFSIHISVILISSFLYPSLFIKAITKRKETITIAYKFEVLNSISRRTALYICKKNICFAFYINFIWKVGILLNAMKGIQIKRDFVNYMT